MKLSALFILASIVFIGDSPVSIFVSSACIILALLAQRGSKRAKTSNTH